LLATFDITDQSFCSFGFLANKDLGPGEVDAANGSEKSVFFPGEIRGMVYLGKEMVIPMVIPLILRGMVISKWSYPLKNCLFIWERRENGKESVDLGISDFHFFQTSP
jgi:hypothetical protein